jgi:hypothetical protein
MSLWKTLDKALHIGSACPVLNLFYSVAQCVGIIEGHTLTLVLQSAQRIMGITRDKTARTYSRYDKFYREERIIIWN